jgi:Domain of unknown function (DUF222)
MAVLETHIGCHDNGDDGRRDDGGGDGGWPAEIVAAITGLERAAMQLQSLDLVTLDDRSQLELVRRVELCRRRIDHGTDRLAGHLDTSGAPAEDGHSSARSALVHLGRLPMAAARARVLTARTLRRLPAVEAAYRRGAIPTEHVRAIVRTASNPRVQRFLADADPLFAEQATEEPYADFCRWLKEWESLADEDGAERDAQTSHDRRHAELVENPDGGFSLQAGLGGLEGACVAEVFGRFVDAEVLADWAEARRRMGDAATDADLARTPRQRRADALTAIFRRAAGSRRSAAPLVNILVDQETFERELARATGATSQTHGDVPAEEQAPGRDASGGPGKRRCQSIDGVPLRPSEAVAAALVGHVRRVVVDADSNVIDLGRRIRLFTGSARDAALIQGALSGRDGLLCAWGGCRRRHGLQVDHLDAAAQGGPTDIVNSLPLCGFHNRLKEHGWRPVRGPDDRWTVVRPDGSQINPPA